jgi:hypothetical protein
LNSKIKWIMKQALYCLYQKDHTLPHDRYVLRMQFWLWNLLPQSRKRKTIQSVNVAAVHELDNVSSDVDSSQWSWQTRSTYRSSISSRASNPTGV